MLEGLTVIEAAREGLQLRLRPSESRCRVDGWNIGSNCLFQAATPKQPPFNRWAYSHVSEIVPSALIFNGEKVCRPPENLREIEGCAIENDGKTLSLRDWQAETFTDGIVILKNGEVVYEQHFGELSRHTPHIFMPMSKSLTALVAGVLATKGILDVDRHVDGIIPEVAQSPYQGATVRDLLGMRVGVEFDENYLASDGKIIEYHEAQNWNPLEPGDSERNLRELFPTLTDTDGGHRQRFRYASPNTGLLSWVLERASGRHFADLVTECIWHSPWAQNTTPISRSASRPRCAGGVCATARDLAKLGLLFATGGKTADGTKGFPKRGCRIFYTLVRIGKRLGIRAICTIPTIRQACTAAANGMWNTAGIRWCSAWERRAECVCRTRQRFGELPNSHRSRCRWIRTLTR